MWIVYWTKVSCHWGGAAAGSVFFSNSLYFTSPPPPRPPKVKKKDAKKINFQKCIPPDLITNRFKDIAEAIGHLGKRC